MKLDPRQYDEMVSRASPPSPVVRDCAWAFLVGGAICTLGEALRQFFLIWYDKTLAGTLTSIALIFLSAIFTLPGWYQKLAAKAGATYVSPFVGRLDDISEDGVELVAHIVRVYRTYGFRTQVLAASIRHTRHIIQCLDAGADVATCPLSAIKGLLRHPLTESGLAQFLADHARVNG